MENENYLSVSNNGKLETFENPEQSIKESVNHHHAVLEEKDYKTLDINRSDFLKKDISAVFYKLDHLIGKDERIPVNFSLQPYRFICHLTIEYFDGHIAWGTGFFISKRCVITAGHCVYNINHKGWAKNIIVMPGRNFETSFGVQSSEKFRSVQGWTNKNSPDFDHGAIILPNNDLSDSVGGYFSYGELKSPNVLDVSGYPLAKNGSQWLSRTVGNNPLCNNPALNDVIISDYTIKYLQDTTIGQSGSPVFINNPSIQVVGVHSGYKINQCVRVRDYILQRWGEWSRL
jgi:glutamyl endopeptidase